MLYPYLLPEKRQPTPEERALLWEDGNFVGGAMILLVTLLSFLFSAVVTVLTANGVLQEQALSAELLGLSNTQYLLLYGAVYTASLGLPTLLSLLLFRKRLPRFHGTLRPAEAPRALLIGIGGCLLANFFAGIFAQLLEQNGFALPEAPDYLEPSLQSLLLNLTVSALLPAVLEELLFRVTLLGVLRRYGDRLAVLLSALLFGVMHGYIAQSLFAFAVGLLLGWLLVTTGSVPLVIGVHFCNNALSLLLEYARLQLPQPLGDLLSVLCMYGLLLAGVVLFIVAAVRRAPFMKMPQSGTLRTGACLGGLAGTPTGVLAVLLLLLRAVCVNFCA